jgi:uncharacterized protein with PIN domain
MGLFHHEKNECEECRKRFANYEEMVRHAHDVHKRHITKCPDCGKLFVHEKDRLHHVKEERERKADIRRHKF